MAEEPPKAGRQAPGGKTQVVLEVLLWIWCLVGLGYFYYSQGFLTLLKQLWDQALG